MGCSSRTLVARTTPVGWASALFLAVRQRAYTEISDIKATIRLNSARKQDFAR